MFTVFLFSSSFFMKRGVNFKDGQTETIEWKAQVSFHIKKYKVGGRRGGRGVRTGTKVQETVAMDPHSLTTLHDSRLNNKRKAKVGSSNNTIARDRLIKRG
jgi:hypothetical protein